MNSKEQTCPSHTDKKTMMQGAEFRSSKSQAKWFSYQKDFSHYWSQKNTKWRRNRGKLMDPKDLSEIILKIYRI